MMAIDTTASTPPADDHTAPSAHNPHISRRRLTNA
jgi:hypothetical protein